MKGDNWKILASTMDWHGTERPKIRTFCQKQEGWQWQFSNSVMCIKSFCVYQIDTCSMWSLAYHYMAVTTDNTTLNCQPHMKVKMAGEWRTWSINISTGGPLYDFTSSHASYFCHTETHNSYIHTTANNVWFTSMTTKYMKAKTTQLYNITAQNGVTSLH